LVTYDADQLGQGRENARSYLRNNPDLADELEKKIKERMGIRPKIDLPAGIDPGHRRGGVQQMPLNKGC
jgi:recombination protein RecA